MTRRFLFATGLAIAVIVVARGTVSAQSVIAHWTFDASSLTISGVNITGAADATGLHNASVQSTGSGTGSPYTSNPIPTTNSITGKFGEGLTLTGFNTVAGGGGQFLTYPRLTELMTANSAPGAPSYSISYWIKTATTNSQQYTILGDWGNAATNPGRFTYGYGIAFSGSTPQMRAQARSNDTGAGSGTDIFARTATATGLNNDNWHMLTWTFNTTSGQLLSYFDGVQIDSFTSSTANKNMILSSSTVGTFGLKGDTGNFLNGTVSLDEVWVVNGILTPSQILDGFNNNYASVFQPPVPTNLVLEVDTVSGATTLKNPTAAPIAISSYRITSANSSLDTSGWDPISTGPPVGGFPQGNGSGNGWEIAPNPSGSEVVEWYLTGSSTINSNGSVSLGNASFPSTNVGDHDNSGLVETADYVAWRKNGLSQSQYDDWKRNYGKRKGAQDLVFMYTLTDNTVKTGTVSYVTSASGSLAEMAAVPEPTSVGVLLVALSCAVFKRRNPFATFSRSVVPE